MATSTELARLAAMANTLRPDWPTRSVLTYLTTEHPSRAYTDLAVALAIIATDPATATPRRMSEAGPWWTATTAGVRTPSTVLAGGTARCHLEGHEHELAHNCRVCRSDHLASMAPEPGDTLALPDDQAATNARGAALVRAANTPRALDGRSLAAGEREDTSDE